MAKLDLSLTREELEAFLASQRTVRVATVGSSGTPHVVPLWFVWLHGTMYLNSTLGNPTVENMLRTGRASAVVDDGTTYDELRGVVITGLVERAEDDPRVAQADGLWSDKYMGGNATPYGRWKDRVWLRLLPEQVASWDFRKIPEAKARRDAQRAPG
jgi:nitroimidazol reductase NimA-like FMN-containing flavoprotein (pyridoxamine 5'-phosphate oxidase superfamily)